MSRNWEAHDEILSDMGARDLLASIRGKTEDEILEAKRKIVEQRADEETRKVKQELQNPSTSSEKELHNEEQEAIFRSAAGLSEFRQSPGELSSGTLQMGQGGVKSQQNKDVEITGFEGEGVRIPKREHFLYYPK